MPAFLLNRIMVIPAVIITVFAAIVMMDLATPLNLSQALEEVEAAGFTVFAQGEAPTGTPTYLVCSSTSHVQSCDFTADGSADDVQIQSAIDACPVNGCRVVLTEGDFNLAAGLVTDGNGIVIEGQGYNTSLIPENNTNIDVITISGSGRVRNSVLNLRIFGNKADNTSGDGIRIASVSTGNDQNHRLMNLYISDVAGNGIRVDNADIREIYVVSVVISACNGNGLELGGTDHRMSDIMIGACAGHGVHILSGNGQYDNIKVFTSGAASPARYGWFVEGNRTQLSNIQAQDNKNHGIVIFDAEHTNVSNCQADGNAVDVFGVGVRIDSDDVAVSNCVATDRAATGKAQDVGMATVAGRTGISIVGGNVTGNASTGLNNNAGSIVKGLVGHVNENSGTATILDTTTSIVVNHGLSITPAVGDCVFIGAEDPTNSPGAHWIDTFTSTQITLNIENDPGVSNYDVGWTCTVY